MTVIGPGVAFMLGSAMLRFYVDVDKVSTGEGTCPATAGGIQDIPVPAVPIQRARWLPGHPGDSSETTKRQWNVIQ